jgi:hypothetical protein
MPVVDADKTCEQVASVVELAENLNVAAREGRLTEEEMASTLRILSNVLEFVDVEKRTELSSSVIDLREIIHIPRSAGYGEAIAQVADACAKADAIFLPVRWSGG